MRQSAVHAAYKTDRLHGTTVVSISDDPSFDPAINHQTVLNVSHNTYIFAVREIRSTFVTACSVRSIGYVASTSLTCANTNRI